MKNKKRALRKADMADFEKNLVTHPSSKALTTGVLKARNFQALYRFEGYVVKEFIGPRDRCPDQFTF